MDSSSQKKPPSESAPTIPAGVALAVATAEGMAAATATDAPGSVFCDAKQGAPNVTALDGNVNPIIEAIDEERPQAATATAVSATSTKHKDVGIPATAATTNVPTFVTMQRTASNTNEHRSVAMRETPVFSRDESRKRKKSTLPRKSSPFVPSSRPTRRSPRIRESVVCTPTDSTSTTAALAAIAVEGVDRLPGARSGIREFPATLPTVVEGAIPLPGSSSGAQAATAPVMESAPAKGSLKSMTKKSTRASSGTKTSTRQKRKPLAPSNKKQKKDSSSSVGMLDAAATAAATGKRESVKVLARKMTKTSLPLNKEQKELSASSGTPDSEKVSDLYMFEEPSKGFRNFLPISVESFYYFSDGLFAEWDDITNVDKPWEEDKVTTLFQFFYIHFPEAPVVSASVCNNGEHVANVLPFLFDQQSPENPKTSYLVYNDGTELTDKGAHFYLLKFVKSSEREYQLTLFDSRAYCKKIYEERIKVKKEITNSLRSTKDISLETSNMTGILGCTRQGDGDVCGALACLQYLHDCGHTVIEGDLTFQVNPAMILLGRALLLLLLDSGGLKFLEEETKSVVWRKILEDDAFLTPPDDFTLDKCFNPDHERNRPLFDAVQRAQQVWKTKRHQEGGSSRDCK